MKSQSQQQNQRNLFDTDVEKHLLETSTCHGLFRIANKQYNIVRRVLWLVVVIGCLSFLGIQLYESISSFLKYELKTSITVNMENKLELPRITICNSNLFMRSQINEMDQQLLDGVLIGFQNEAEMFKKEHFGDFEITEELKEQFSAISHSYWNITPKFQTIEDEILDSYKSKISTISFFFFFNFKLEISCKRL